MAEKAEECFQTLIRLLKNANKHLDLIYDSFQNVSDTDTDLLKEHRVKLREYRDQVSLNFKR
ncbi:MAG: hypothetical protein HC877_23245, partial [Thioploca sp.]|nr:hypothetical protein [Thioploca sp.]